MSNPYSVVIDACVLTKGTHRNLLLHLAAAECFRPIWSEFILEEMVDALNKGNADGQSRRRQLELAFPGATAHPGFIHLVGKIQLKDENDRHVVAVALQEGADAICTDNLRDFGLSTVDVMGSDEFFLNTIDLMPVRAIETISAMRRQMSRLSDGHELIALLKDRELEKTAKYLSAYADRL